MNIRSPLIQSLAGFFAALLVGALVPRTIGFLLKRVVFQSARNVLAVAAAGLLADRLARWLAGPRSSSTSHPPEQTP